MKYIIAVLALCSFLFAWEKAFGETIDTGNILTNSTFGTGTTYSTDGWTVSSGTHGHNYMAAGNGNAPGGSVAAEEDTEIKQTVTLSEKTNMTTQEIQNGWSSTIGADIWYWNQYDNTTTLKQTITGSDGSVSTQQRVIQNTGCGSINCGSFTNYTDTHVQGSNTQTDFDIEVSVTNTNNRTGHWGPDIDDVTLNISYTHIPPIDTDTQEIIDDVDEDITDIIEDIPEDFDWYTDDIVLDDTYTWEEEEYTWEDDYILEDDFYFEEEYTMEEDMYFEEFEMEEFDIGAFEQPPMFEEFEEFETFEEMPVIIEEVFFEEDYTMEPPPVEMMEEIFTEEFEEDFTEFLEETGMEEEFMEFLEDEGITAEEFFEEIAEEEFNDELTEESFEEFEEPLEERAVTEESIPEVIDSEEEGIETEIAESEPLEEEKEVAQNEATEESEDIQEEESDSEGTEDSEVQAADSEEQDSVQSEGRDDVDSDKGVATDVAKVESKLKQKLKAIAKQIAKVTKVNTQNLSKEDIFFKNNTALNAYKKMQFYKSKDIYTDQNMDLFNQIDLGVYAKDIYTNITLASYTQNDPVEVHRVELYKAQEKTNRLKLELEALRNGG